MTKLDSHEFVFNDTENFLYSKVLRSFLEGSQNLAGPWRTNFDFQICDFQQNISNRYVKDRKIMILDMTRHEMGRIGLIFCENGANRFQEAF